MEHKEILLAKAQPIICFQLHPKWKCTAERKVRFKKATTWTDVKTIFTSLVQAQTRILPIPSPCPSTDKDFPYWVHFSLSLSFIPRDLHIRLAGKKLSQRFSSIWSSPRFTPTSPREHRDLLDMNHVWRVWRPATRGLDLVWKLFDTFSFFSSGCFKYTSNKTE
jgi:hypothetical protein